METLTTVNWSMNPLLQPHTWLSLNKGWEPTTSGQPILFFKFLVISYCILCSMETKYDPGKKLDLGVSKVVNWVVSCGLEEYLCESPCLMMFVGSLKSTLMGVWHHRNQQTRQTRASFPPESWWLNVFQLLIRAQPTIGYVTSGTFFTFSKP